jgi:hypothetical protein
MVASKSAQSLRMDSLGVIGALTVIVIRDRPHRIEPRSFIESLGKGAES